MPVRLQAVYSITRPKTIRQYEKKKKCESAAINYMNLFQYKFPEKFSKKNQKKHLTKGGK